MSIADKLTQAANNVPLVYQAGKNKEWSDFWDSFQDKGARTSYNSVFRFKYWNKNTFKPKYNINIAGDGDSAFRFFNQNTSSFDFAEHLNKLGITIDCSNCTKASYLFYYSYLTHLPELDLSSAETIAYAFRYSTVSTIDKIKLKEDGNQMLSYSFSNTPFLKNIVVEGTIGQDGVDLSASTVLTKESIISFINALSSSAAGKAITFSLTAVNSAFETADGADDGSTSAEWENLTAEKSNWTIALL